MKRHADNEKGFVIKCGIKTQSCLGYLRCFN